MAHAFESITSAVNDKHIGSAFSHTMREIQDLMSKGAWSDKKMDKFNRDVDFEGLGFPEDFNIIDVDGPVVVSVSEDFSKLQTRDSDTLKLMSERSNSASQIEAYKEDFPRVVAAAEAADEVYTVESGDSLYKISKRALEDAWERTPTPQEITEHWKQIAELNEIKNPDLIYPGDELKMPTIKASEEREEREEDEYEDSDEDEDEDEDSDDMEGLSVEDPALRPVGDIFKPAAAVGVLSDEAKVDGLEGETTVVENTDGSFTRTYVGEYDDDLGITSTTVNSQLEIDEDGNIKSSIVTYAGSGITIEFDCGDGTTESIKTKSVITKFDKELGRFVSEISSPYPINRQYLAHTDMTGAVTLFEQIR